MSPRLGVTAKLTADSRTMLRASYGRFNQGVLTGELSPDPSRRDADDHDGVRRGHGRLHDARLGGRSQNQPGVRSGDTRTPHTDEYSIGVDRQLPLETRGRAAYIHKRGANFIGWTDVGGNIGRTPHAARRPMPASFRAHERRRAIGGSC